MAKTYAQMSDKELEKVRQEADADIEKARETKARVQEVLDERARSKRLEGLSEEDVQFIRTQGVESEEAVGSK